MENAVEFKMLEKPNIKGYTLIEGFPGIGLIGTIAVGYLADKLNARCIGYILSKSFPPMASIHKGKPVLPARIYVDDKHKLVLLFSELVVPSSVVYDISEGILKWAEKNKIKRIISLAGMTARLGMENKKPEVYGIASNDKIAKELVDKNVKLITEECLSALSYCFLLVPTLLRSLFIFASICLASSTRSFVFMSNPTKFSSFSRRSAAAPGSG